MPKKGHIPERTCIACRKKLPKKELIRFCVKDDKIIMDKEQKGGGRGAYFCAECLPKIKNRKIFRKLLYALRLKESKEIVMEQDEERGT